jgi:tRNA(Met) C34 N-acetyltransferase TmcA
MLAIAIKMVPQKVGRLGCASFSPNNQYNLTLELSTTELNFLLAPFDLKCLESHANDALDYHVALDLLPGIASLYFNHCLSKQIRITAMQSSILLALGLQRKSIEEVEVRTYW